MENFTSKMPELLGTGTDVTQRGKELLKKNKGRNDYSSFYKNKDLAGRSGILPL
jgi:hypothetical protein